jgi:putative methionine-R-sulfoxide reductase with GAF domain
MSRVALKQLIGRPNDARAVLTAITDALGLPHAIEDHEGQLLHGAPLDEAGNRFPVTLDGRGLGWVSGSESARVVAALLDHLASEQAEKKALGAEVLHLYREVNLIYSFSQKIAALLDLDRVARLTLHEASHLIVATDGVVMLLDDETGSLTTLAGFGDELPRRSGVRVGHGVIGTVAATGIAEVVNDVHADPRRIVDPGVRSLICAPLKVGERVIGIIALASTHPMTYTAGELKLLSTLGLHGNGHRKRTAVRAHRAGGRGA